MIDKFYTPKGLAKDLVASLELSQLSNVIDPTCGSGNLLNAAAEVFENVKCIGIDRDAVAIRRLKRLRPDWILSKADILNSKSYKKTTAYFESNYCEFLLLNPPYSQKLTKYVEWTFRGRLLKCSVAMSFVLHALETFSPEKGAMLIVPESMMYSELDEVGRHLISTFYDLKIVGELHRTTFHGAKVRTVAVKITPSTNTVICKSQIPIESDERISLNIIRGGMQMHTLKSDEVNGFPVVHSVNLADLYKDNMSTSGITQLVKNGVVSGKFILIPRVGLPHLDLIKIVDLKTEVQLSDCVIAISANTKSELNQILKIIIEEKVSFLGLYRGTGARYITKARLATWLIERGALVS